MKLIVCIFEYTHNISNEKLKYFRIKENIKMQKDKIVIDIIDEFVESISNTMKSQPIEEDLDNVRYSDGRKSGAPECCKRGSYIYFLYDSSGEIIYIGETGKSVKNRLYSDGSGAHCNKEWFNKVVKLKYYNNAKMDYNTRKLLERALISKYNPKYNDNKLLK
jgi:hypothetical protein